MLFFIKVIEVTIPKFHIPQLTRHSSIVFRNFNSAKTFRNSANYQHPLYRVGAYTERSPERIGQLNKNESSSSSSS